MHRLLCTLLALLTAVAIHGATARTGPVAPPAVDATAGPVEPARPAPPPAAATADADAGPAVAASQDGIGAPPATTVVTGALRSADGLPLRGRLEFASPGHDLGTFAAHGRFAVALPGAVAAALHLRAAAPGHLTRAVDLTGPHGDRIDVGDLVLERGAGLRGRLVAAPGPPAEARLRLDRATAPRSTELALAAADFAFDALPAGPCAVWVRDRTRAWTRVGALRLDPGRVLDLGEVALGAGRALEIAVHSANGHPIAAAEVTLRDGDDHALDASRTDDAGVTRCAGLPDVVLLQVTALGHDPHRATLDLARGAADGRPIAVTLEPVPQRTGTVLSARDGRPLVGARIVRLPGVADRRAPPPLLPDDAPSVRCDEAGRFAIAWPSERTWDLVVTAPEHAPIVLSAPPATDVGVVVAPIAAAVRGRATWADGSPYRDRVELWLEGRTPADRGAVLGPPPPCPGGQLIATTVADVDGHFAFDGLPAGRGVVAPAGGLGGPAVAVALDPRRVATPRLHVPPLGGVRGSAPGARRVFAYGGPACTRVVDVDARGRFRIDGLPAGTYLLGASRTAAMTELHVAVQEHAVGRLVGALAVRCAPGRNELVDLPPPVELGALEGRAFLGGAPAAGSAVELRCAAGAGARRRCGAVDGDGRFRLEALVPGDYELVLRSDGVAAPAQACRVLPGATAIVTVQAPRTDRPATDRPEPDRSPTRR
ncbi:MAG: hypothetical protein AB7O97_00435 [Planctomycetota bacterium]